MSSESDISESGDILVYDEQENESVSMYKIALNEKDKAFLQYLYEASESNSLDEGFVSTKDIKSTIGLTRSDISYRYDKFGREKYTEILEVTDMDSDRLPRGLERMKQARLTEKGKKLIRQGFIGDPNEDHMSDEVILTKEQFEDFQDNIDQLERKVDSLRNTVDHHRGDIDDLEDEFNSVRKEIRDVADWRTRVTTFMYAARYIFEDMSSVNLGKYIRKAKKNLDEDEDTGF